MRELVTKTLRVGTLLIVLVYFILAGGLKIVEFSAGRHRSGEEAIAARGRGDTIRVYDRGLSSLKRRLEIIAQARQTLELEFFIYNVDQASRIVTQALIKRAQEGLKIRILVDSSWPVFQLGPAYARRLKDSGIEVRYYNTTGLYRVATTQHRSHRKLLIADGKTVMTGGRNIADEYFDMDERADFLDTDIEVSGPIVGKVRESFELYWRSSMTKAPAEADDEDLKAEAFTKPHADDQKVLAAMASMDASPPVHVCPDLQFVTDFPNPGPQNRKVFAALGEEMASAKKQVLAESPYFVIRGGGFAMLEDLQKRGVQTTVLTNTLRSTDAAFTVASLHWRLGALAKTGLRLYGFGARPVEGQTEHPFFAKEPRWSLHSKRAVIDDDTTVIGTYNIDPRSANLNSELIFICRGNRALASEVRRSIEKRLASSEELIGPKGDTYPARLLKGATFKQYALYLAVFPLANFFDFLL